ncbi:site-specific integrase [Legionella sp. km772]|nr:site-specific integrase [Legionella sp. km772]
MTNTRAVRRILQLCFDKAAEILAVSHPDESDGMREVTVHWLRHTAISEDVKSRPLNHVRDDAGHQSIITTNRYVNTLHRERHQSARNKPIQPSKDNRCASRDSPTARLLEAINARALAEPLLNSFYRR